MGRFEITEPKCDALATLFSLLGPYCIGDGDPSGGKIESGNGIYNICYFCAGTSILAARRYATIWRVGRFGAMDNFAPFF